MALKFDGEPTFAKELVIVHYCNGERFIAGPIVLCSSCKYDGGSFERSLPRGMVEDILEYQQFLHSMGFPIEDKYDTGKSK